MAQQGRRTNFPKENVAHWNRVSTSTFCIFILAVISSFLTSASEETSCPQLCLCSGTGNSTTAQGKTPTTNNATFSVETVNCTSVGLSKFPSDLPDSVRVLDLSYNGIDSLPTPGFLASLESLEIIILKGNSLKGPLGSGAFRDIRSLEKVDLSHNDINFLNENSFEGCDRLKMLDLSGNKQLSDIPNLNTTSIQEILVRDCGIFEPGLKPLPSSLLRLSLRGNPLGEMPSIASSNLKVLDTRSCSLSAVHNNALQRLPSLTRLYVSKNPRLTSLSHARSDSLRIIDAEDCSLGSIDEINGESTEAAAPLSSMSALTHAHLAGNRIHHVGPNSFVSNNLLVHLDLSRNGLKALPKDTLTPLHNIQLINVSFNSLSSLDEECFSSNHHLEEVDLSHNGRLTYLPAFHAPSIRHLHASRCDISWLGIKGEGNPLARMPNLMLLDLCHNPLESLPTDMSSQALTDLDLSFCRISVIQPETLMGLSHLQWLDLRGNRIASLDPNSVRRLKYLDISDNPWNCKCDDPRFQQLWKVVEDLEPQNQPLHCAPSESETKLQKVRAEPGEGLKRWEEVCDRSAAISPTVPASSMWSMTVAIVLAAAGVIVGTIVIRHWLKEKRKERADEEAELRRRRRRRRRGAEESGEEGGGGEGGNTTQDIVTVRRLRGETMPPPYEEAVLMPRPQEVEVRLEVTEVVSTEEGAEAQPDTRTAENGGENGTRGE